MQRLLRADLDENAGTRPVQRAQPVDEPDRRGHLTAEQVQHGVDVGVRRIELAGHVRHDRQTRRTQVKPTQDGLEWFAGRRHDRGVKRVADREPGGVHAGGLKRRDSTLHGVGGTADDSLVGAVDVRDDDVSVGLADDPLDLGERSGHGRHRAVVGTRQGGHLPAAGADRLEGSVERQRAGGHQGAVFAQAVAHHHVRPHAVCLEQPGQGQIRGQHRRLGDLGLHELLFQPLRGGLIGAVGEDVVGERFTQQRCS